MPAYDGGSWEGDFLRDFSRLPIARLLNRFGLLRHLRLRESVDINGVGTIIPVRFGTGLDYRSDAEPWMSALLPVYDETTPVGARRAGRQNQLLGLLADLDYAVARGGHADAALAFVATVDTHSSLELCDYLFYPAESAGALR